MEPMQRILVIRIDFLGDMLCTTAFLRALKERWPGAELHVVANRYNAAALAETRTSTRSTPTSIAVNASATTVRTDARALRPAAARTPPASLAVRPRGRAERRHASQQRAVRAADRREGLPLARCRDRIRRSQARACRRAADVPRSVVGFPARTRTRPCRCRPPRVVGSSRPRAAGCVAPAARCAHEARVGLFVTNKAVERRWPADRWRDLAERLAPYADVIVFRDPAVGHAPEDDCGATCARAMLRRRRSPSWWPRRACSMRSSPPTAPRASRVGTRRARRRAVRGPSREIPALASARRAARDPGAGATVDAIGVDAVERAVNHLLPQAAQRDERLADAAHTQPAAAAAAPVIMTIAS